MYPLVAGELPRQLPHGCSGAMLSRQSHGVWHLDHATTPAVQFHIAHTGKVLADLLFVLPAAHMDVCKGAWLGRLTGIWPSLCQHLLCRLSSKSAPVRDKWLYHAWLQTLGLHRQCQTLLLAGALSAFKPANLSSTLFTSGVACTYMTHSLTGCALASRSR